MNKTMNMKFFRMLPVLLAAVGCAQVVEENEPEVAQVVKFSAAVGEASQTRTAYSGTVLGTDRTFERIDWVDGDKFRVYSDGAATEGGSHVADYEVTRHLTDGVRSLAAVISPDPLLWGGCEEAHPHTFYAIYPVPGATGVDAALALNENVVTGNIPAVQSLTRDGLTFAPDMNYCYMYASTRITASAIHAPVTLTFKPLVTAYRLKILSLATKPADSDLASVSIRTTAEDARLSGGFTATLQPDDSFSAVPSGTGSAAVTFNFPAGVVLSTTDPLSVTLFTLPVQQSSLELVLTFESGLVRRMTLKDGDAQMHVTAGEKIYLENITVPGALQMSGSASLGNITPGSDLSSEW